MKKRSLKIIRYPNEFLRRKARSVKLDEIRSPEVRGLILEMEDAMKKEKGIGLAATQVGSDLRICIADIEGDFLVLLNPKIKSFSRRKDTFEEGCLSFPGKFLPIERPAGVKVAALDVDGKKIKIKADGLLARVLQHEIDHLDGVLMIDRACPEK